MTLIEFRGAARDDLAGQIEYTGRGPVWINPCRISCVYDHTILIDGHKIRVMETAEEIMNAITGRLYNVQRNSNTAERGNCSNERNNHRVYYFGGSVRRG